MAQAGVPEEPHLTPGPLNKSPESSRMDHIDPEEYTLRKRLPRKLPKGKNDVYVNRKTDSKAQLMRVKKMLESGYNVVFVHGLGAAVNRAINLALQIKEQSLGTLDVAVNTSTVELVDDLDPEQDHLEPKTVLRNTSTVHIKLYRIDPSQDHTKPKGVQNS